MRILRSVLAHARQITLNVAGIVRRLVERRREQQDQPRILAYQILVQRLHRDTGSVRVPSTGDDAPTLGDRVDLAFVARARPERRAVVEVRPGIPLSIPGRALDRFGVAVGSCQHFIAGPRVATLLRVNGELAQCRDQEPCEPYALSFSLDSHSVHSLSLIHISEPTRLGMISYAVFCLKKKKK